MYVGVTLLLAVGAINSQNNLLFAALGLAIGGLLVSGVLSGSALMGVRARREPLPDARVGSPTSISYRVQNLSKRLSAFALHIDEEASSDSDRAPAMHVFVDHVPAAGTVSVRAAFTPTRRGLIPLPAFRVWTTFPFGLTKKSVRFVQPDALLVLPATHELRTDAFDRVRSHATTGAGAYPTPGVSEDYYGVREYVPGDSPRRIAWRASARTGALVVRQDSAPAPVRVWIVLRATASDDPSAIEDAASLAASLLIAADRQGFAAGFLTSDRVLVHPPRSGRAHVRRVLRDLAMWQPAPDARQESASSIAERAGAFIVVQAGDIDRASAPPHALHLTAGDLSRLRADVPTRSDATP